MMDNVRVHWVVVWVRNLPEEDFLRISPPIYKINKISGFSRLKTTNIPVPDFPSVSDRSASGHVATSPYYHRAFDEYRVSHPDVSHRCDKCLLVDFALIGRRVCWFGRRTVRADIRVESHEMDTIGACLVVRDTVSQLWLPLVGTAWVYSTKQHVHLHDDAPRLLIRIKSNKIWR